MTVRTHELTRPGGFIRRARLSIYFDGGCRPNPGPMELAVVVRGVAHFRHDLGRGDNSIAEWLALIHAVEIAVASNASDVLLIGDATAVIQQALGNWRCHNAGHLPYLARFKDGAARLSRLHLKQVGRSKNLAGIALANLRR